MKIEESIAKIKQADNEAFEELLRQYLPVIRNAEARYYLLDFDSDDWLQEGRLALHKAALTYKDDQGTTFGLYFKLIFENAIRSLLRKQKALKRKANTEARSFDDPETECQLSQFSYAPQVIDDLIIRETLESETNCLSELEQIVFACYLRSFDEAEISQLLGKEVRTVKGAIDRVKRKIRRRINQ
ncbi:RNA polymerase sigma factor [Enterococcus sp. CSURQ0835]|uniref:RNA polymerase sigma factor n=1 Tax=Enterococcus sp. CSURQ0835 TaxID=2681394 RepID=UPI001356D582|nr:sigma-70 family RNA polymerase sigma factor [Enterococcus sp. CSURQ0835]